MRKEFIEAKAALRPKWTKERGEHRCVDRFLDMNPRGGERDGPTAMICDRGDRFVFVLDGTEILPEITIHGLADAKAYIEARAVALYAAETLNLSMIKEINASWK